MEIRTYLLALRKHWVTVVVLAVLGAVAAGVAYFLTPPVYSSSVTFYVSTPLTDGSNPLSAGQFAQARVNSYVSLLESEQLAFRVIRDQRLAMTTAEVMKEVKATAELNTVLVTATVDDSSPERALAISRGIANTFGAMVDQLDNQNRKADIVVINAVSGPTLLPDPISPSKRIYGGLGLLAGLAVGATIAILRELLDNSVRSPEVGAALTQAPVIGAIDFDPEAKRSPLLLKEATTSIRAESVRQLRTNLQFIDVTRSADVLLVTSAVPDEGKSVVSVNLALSFVEFGNSVLLIEADLRRPRISAYLGVENEVGLTSVLVGQVEVGQAIQAWGADGLSILPSGSTPPNPSELLGSAEMTNLVGRLRQD
ncbi:MAG: capsular exopolysaccharide family, partial [Friedmanniella sp.]|nr:capsular exopolysaccharide family [Friedmanniella sp.]